MQHSRDMDHDLHGEGSSCPLFAVRSQMAAIPLESSRRNPLMLLLVIQSIESDASGMIFAHLRWTRVW
jgi:hypothetical protein